MNSSTIEQVISGYPIFEYVNIGTDSLVFSDKARYICENECEHYGKAWYCPPVIDELDVCIARCRSFDSAFIFSTVSEVEDSIDFSTHLQARREHEEISREIFKELRRESGDMLLLSTGCTLCDECTYPDAPCRHPGEMTCTVESHGIIILQTVAEQGMNFDCGGNLVTYFSVILYNS